MPKALVSYYSRTGNTKKMAAVPALLIHGMVVRGDHRFDHYGPVAIGRPDRRSLDCCEAHAKNLAALTKKLFP